MLSIETVGYLFRISAVAGARDDRWRRIKQYRELKAMPRMTGENDRENESAPHLRLSHQRPFIC